MGIGLVQGKSKLRQFKLGDNECEHEDCLHPPLRGRNYCETHAELYEPSEESEAPGTETDVYVYFIGIDGDDVVKIGRTSGNAKDRLKSLQTGHYKQLKLLASISMPFEVERWIHKGLADVHVRGEWFKRTEKVNKIIEAAKSGDWQRFFQAFA